MPRAPRIAYPGAYYHVTSRGNERKNIFNNDLDRQKFLSILKHFQTRFNVIIYCYVLMDNHYHLVLQTPQGNLAAFMHSLNTAYSVYINQKYDRTGHLFQGRYKSILVDQNSYLLQLIRYVHMNPVRAGLVSKPEQYPWSSYSGYIGGPVIHSWINYREIYNYFSSSIAKAREALIAFTNSRSAEAFKPVAISGDIAVLGDDAFVQKMIDLSKTENISEDRVLEINIEEILQTVAASHDTSVEKLTSRGSRYNYARQLAIYMVKRYSNLTNDQIGRLFGGLHHSAVSKAFSRIESELEQNPALRGAVRDITTLIKEIDC